MWRRGGSRGWRREHSQLEEEEREASLSDALADRTKVVKLVVDKLFVDKGFGFGRVPTGEVIFIHASVVRNAEVLMIGADAWVQVVRDDARAKGRYRACKAWGHAAWKEERDKERATKVAEQVRRAAALTAELAAQSEKEVSEVCRHPPGLRDEAAAVTPQPTCSLSLVTSNPLQTSQGFLSFSGKFLERQPRSDTRAQEKAALADETLSFLAKVTDRDEASMRPKFEGMKLEDLRRERDRWKKRAEEKQRLQGKKEEAWELFQRQPRLGTSRKQKVTSKRFSPFDLGPPDAEEVFAGMGGQASRASSGRRPKEGSQRKAKHGAGGLQLPETSSMGEDMGSLRVVSCSWKLSRDVRLDVELTALVSSVETTLCSNSI